MTQCPIMYSFPTIKISFFRQGLFWSLLSPLQTLSVTARCHCNAPASLEYKEEWYPVFSSQTNDIASSLLLHFKPEHWKNALWWEKDRLAKSPQNDRTVESNSNWKQFELFGKANNGRCDCLCFCCMFIENSLVDSSCTLPVSIFM